MCGCACCFGQDKPCNVEPVLIDVVFCMGLGVLGFSSATIEVANKKASDSFGLKLYLAGSVMHFES